MKPSRYILLSALVATSAVSATQHQIRGRPDHFNRLAARSPQFGGIFGFPDSSESTSASRTSASDSGSLFPTASASSAAAAASSSAAAAAASSSAAAAASSSSAAVASASASRAAAESSSIAAAAASSAAASVSSAAAAESSVAASRSSASAASASRASASSASASMTTSVGLTTTLTATVQATPTAPTATSSPATDSSSGSGSGASTGLIIGVSVAGGVLVLATFIFLYFKFGTRRFSNFEDGDADIKWPELKHDPDSNVMQPLPARRTGGAGFDMGDESDNEGHDHEGNDAGMGEKGRDSFTGSTTALAAAPPAGYGVNDYTPGMDHGYGIDPAAGYYQDHHMYSGHQYGMQTSPGGGPYSDNGNPYGVDPYAHTGMPHSQQNQYSHAHYQ
ncbi:uncharacterized protein UTRI_03717 [Ustilago trichophora]|uniref:Uncharacterized protein n=1 Tax=Ustilago trichophora TaxID=86804 RepID=A0A5C3E4T7_9BASI|nr:uncharacterized protein UTRI_03717 [Ustilago trichophora]